MCRARGWRKIFANKSECTEFSPYLWLFGAAIEEFMDM
jgi:hypothetical protein